MLPPSVFASSVHRTCVGLDRVLQTIVFRLRELALSHRLASDVRVLFGLALVELLLLHVAAGILANVDAAHLFLWP